MESNTTLSSKSPSIKWWDRIDPLHEITWSETISATWEDVALIQHDFHVDEGGHLAPRTIGISSPLARSDFDMYNARSIMAMAMLNEWGQLTTFQLGTLLGFGYQAMWNTMSMLYSGGLVRRQIPGWWTSPNPEDSGSGSLWRINRKSWRLESWLDGLSQLEWILFTNGADPVISTVGAITPSAIRHNMAASEVCIKAMESIPEVAGAWGEAHLSGASFLDEKRQSLLPSDCVGDCALVLKDGRIVIFEITGNRDVERISATYVRKVATWCAVAGYSDLDIHVVFLNVSQNSDTRKMAYLTKIGLEKDAQTFISSSEVMERGQSRIWYANAHDWFPLARAISPEFLSLDASSGLTGISSSLVGSPFTGRVVEDHVINTLGALHTPSWIANHPEES